MPTHHNPRSKQNTSTDFEDRPWRDLRRHDLPSADALNEAAARDKRVNVRLRTYIDIQRAEVLARLHEPTRAFVLFAGRPPHRPTTHPRSHPHGARVMERCGVGRTAASVG